jgi:hypothetical protein
MTETDTQDHKEDTRSINISNSVMDKEMFYALLHNFEGNVYLHGVSFSDIERPKA